MTAARHCCVLAALLGRLPLMRAVASCRKLHSGASCLLCLQRGSPEPYQSSSTNFTFSPHDAVLLAALRSYLASCQPHADTTRFQRQIKDLRHNESSDLIARVSRHHILW